MIMLLVIQSFFAMLLGLKDKQFYNGKMLVCMTKFFYFLNRVFVNRVSRLVVIYVNENPCNPRNGTFF